MSSYPSFDLPPVQPPTPIPWSTHCRQYSSMEQLTEQPVEDPDSPMEDTPPIEPEPEPTTYYEPNTFAKGDMHTLSPEESPVAPWQEYLTQPNSPVSCKHSLSPTSPSSAPIRQRTSQEGSYQSIMPTASSPLVGTSPQSQGNQMGSSEGSTDTSSSTQSSADDADNNMTLNWVSINTDYCKG